MITRRLMVALLVAAMPLTAAAECEGAAGPPRKGDSGAPGRGAAPGPARPGEVESPSCDEVGGPPRGLHGEVVGSAWDEPDYDVTCLEIETKAGRVRLVRVSRHVFDRCIEGDRYPQCAA